MESLRGFIRLMSQAPKGLVAALLVLVVLSSATDGIGFLLLVPLLGLMGGDGQDLLAGSGGSDRLWGGSGEDAPASRTVTD